MVKIICYGQVDIMTRKQAKQQYLQGILCSEGSERERYVKIYTDLICGEKVARDE